MLELGAAGALPSLMAACNGASKVVITDYPEKVLIDMIDANVKKNLPELLIRDTVHVKVRVASRLLRCLPHIVFHFLNLLGVPVGV